jgi:hypothetical protein
MRIKKQISLFLFLFLLVSFFSAGFSRTAAAEGDEVRLDIGSTVEKTTKSRVRIAGHTTPGAAVKMYVNGSDQGKVKVGRKGKISKRVVLNAMGANEILVTAENENGNKSVTRSVTKEAKRAIDRPLGLDIIHTENVTNKSIILISGEASGVSEVNVVVDDFEWGWAVVKRKSGYYEMKVRLAEGRNTVKVTATKGDDYVTVTKIVEKI